LLTDDVPRTEESSRVVDVAARERIVYLAPDCTDSAVWKRARAFRQFGHELLSFSFRRDRYNIGVRPDWPNVELGKSVERRRAARLGVVGRALRLIVSRRRDWRAASMIYARNLDLAWLALIGRWMTRSTAPLVYEVLDVHPLLTDRRLRGALVRWAERQVLRRCRLLVVSSPAYLRHYFLPRQRYHGATLLLENKWPRASLADHPRKLPWSVAEPYPVWTIGWFGNLRCLESLRMLTELADALPDRVKIVMRGCASLLPEQVLRQAMHGRPQLIFSGEYVAPDDLPVIYTQVHFNWCVDFSDGENSLWLLPNRLYEGGYFGIPAIGIAAHETGRVIAERKLGVTLDAPYAEDLKQLLLNMTRQQYERLRGGVEGLSDEYFVEVGDPARCMRERMAVE
jgi:succinoglycan biosynthesis protein ExoL